MQFDRVKDAAFTIFVRQRRNLAGALIATIPHAEVRGRQVTHSLSFDGDDQSVDRVLAPALAEGVNQIVAVLPQREVTTRATEDHGLAVPGLVFGRLRIRAKAMDAIAGRAVTLGFDHFVGGMQNAFAASTYFDRPTLDAREALGVRALEDVVTPLLNMAASLKATPGILRTPDAAGRIDAQLDRIETRAEELEYQASLLRRYVTECAPARARFQGDAELAMAGDGGPLRN